MAYTTSKGEKEDKEVIFNNLGHLHIAYQELLSNSSTLSIGYKDFKKKKFNVLQKENDLLKKENESLKDDKAKNTSKINTKFVNESKNLKNILKNKRHPYDKFGIGYDKKKYLKKDKSTSHCVNCGKFGYLCYDCGDCKKKRSSKPFKTNQKGPKRIWVPKNMMVFVVDLLDSKKETSIIVPVQWLLMSHDRRKVYVPRPKS
ncbi:hypothetical protein CR513_41367, partial [Mucuna pruriens]